MLKFKTLIKSELYPKKQYFLKSQNKVSNIRLFDRNSNYSHLDISLRKIKV